MGAATTAATATAAALVAERPTRHWLEIEPGSIARYPQTGAVRG